MLNVETLLDEKTLKINIFKLYKRLDVEDWCQYSNKYIEYNLYLCSSKEIEYTVNNSDCWYTKSKYNSERIYLMCG